MLGKRRIIADTALRLARYFQMPPQLRLGLQMDCDLDVMRRRGSDRDNQMKICQMDSK